MTHFSKTQANIITSSSHPVPLSGDLTLTRSIVSEEGYLLAVRTLDEKDTYNEVENNEGVIQNYGKNQILIGALGERQALRGYSGIVPQTIKAGDELHILNKGGMIGKCLSPHPELGPPMRVEVLGAVMVESDHELKHACVQDYAIEWSYSLEDSKPIVMVSGTCMHVGKTYAAGEIIKQLSSNGYRVAAAKLTGASLIRDVRAMQDQGAVAVTHFGEAGVVSTTSKNILPMAKGLINHLNKKHPDVIVVELGDGIIGPYGVDSILMDKQLQKFTSAHVVAAHDLMGCWAAERMFTERFGDQIHLMTGPVTDNDVGVDYINNTLGIDALNARASSGEIGNRIEELMFAGKRKAMQA